MGLSGVDNRDRINHEASSPSSFTTVHEVPEAPCGTSSYSLDEFGAAFAQAGAHVSRDIGILWPPVSGGLADFQVAIAPPSPPSPPAPHVPESDEVHAAEAPLRRLLALASAVGLPRQIEREEAH